MEAQKKECTIPFSLQQIEESLQNIMELSAKNSEIPAEVMNQFRSYSAGFFKKYGKECSCDACYAMVSKLITIIMSKINVKVLNPYEINISSISFDINEHVPSLTVVVEGNNEEPAKS